MLTAVFRNGLILYILIGWFSEYCDATVTILYFVHEYVLGNESTFVNTFAGNDLYPCDI